MTITNELKLKILTTSKSDKFT